MRLMPSPSKAWPCCPACSIVRVRCSVNIEFMRAFVKLREMLASNKDLAVKLNAMEHKLESHDQAIAGVLNAIRELMRPPETKKRPIGFVTPQEKK